MNWLRLYTTVLDNPKLQRLPGETFKQVVNLWCLASIHNGTLPPVSDVAFRLRCTETQAAELLEDLISRNVMDRTEHGIVPHDWEEHQYASDSSTQRVQKHRKIKAERAVTSGETLTKRFSNVIEQNRTEQNRYRTDTHSACVRDALPNLRKPNADDLNGQTSQKFEEWFAIWASIRGNAYRPHAFQAYVSTVLLAKEADAMACAESYIAGPGADPGHGYRPDNFLFEMARDSFKTRWPTQQRAPERRETAIESAMRKAKEAKNGTH